MEANQRRYRRVANKHIGIENDIEQPVSKNILKQQMRKLLTERRTVVGPNGEEIRIPKHMAVDDIIQTVKKEYGLTTSEIAGILVVLKRLSINPEFRGKVNRVVVSGIETPLRIERTGKNSNGEIFLYKENNSSPRNNVMDKTVESSTTARTFSGTSYTVLNETECRNRFAEINAATADRYRRLAAEQKRDDEARRAQDENLEKQLNAHYAQQNAIRTYRRRAGLAVAMLLGAIYVTGLIVDVANMTKQAMTPGENLTPIEMQQDSERKLFSVTSEDIATFSKEVTPLVNSQKDIQHSDLNGYQSFEVSIDNVSQGLKQNTNLSNVLNRFSNTAETPVIFGEIASYQEFEKLLENGNDALYTSGPAYFANFSRQVIHGMLKDKYGAEKVVATYEKKGENDQIYEFYIRYFKAGSSNERTPEGRVNMTRNADGRLQTKEYHTLPYEVYELLAIIGEFSDFSNNSDGPAFNIEGYATKFTEGDIEKAKKDLKERMIYGTEAMRNLIKGRVRDEQVKQFLEYGRDE